MGIDIVFESFYSIRIFPPRNGKYFNTLSINFEIKRNEKMKDIHTFYKTQTNK